MRSWSGGPASPGLRIWCLADIVADDQAAFRRKWLVTAEDGIRVAVCPINDSTHRRRLRDFSGMSLSSDKMTKFRMPSDRAINVRQSAGNPRNR